MSKRRQRKLAPFIYAKFIMYGRISVTYALNPWQVSVWRRNPIEGYAFLLLKEKTCDIVIKSCNRIESSAS